MRHLPIFAFLCAFLRLSDAQLQWSTNYHLKAVLTVPSANLVEPYEVWLDGQSGRSRVDFYDGITKLFREYDRVDKKYKYFKIQPETSELYLNKEICHEIAPDSNENQMYSINSYLPTKKFQYVHDEVLNGTPTKKYVYQYRSKIKEPRAQVHVIFAMWVMFKDSVDGSITVPIRFDYNLIEGEKVIDHYRHDYIFFDAIRPNISVLLTPSGVRCSNFIEIPQQKSLDALEEFIDPSIEHLRIKKAFYRFQTVYGKKYTNDQEAKERMQNFKSNLRYINSVNRQQRSFKLAINHLADLSDKEIEIFMGTRVLNKQIEEFYTRSDNEKDEDEDDDFLDINNVDDANVALDWRDVRAVSPVKDQTAMCGACYAFTAAAALESGFYIANGCRGESVREISEQAFVDCTWGINPNNGNVGCEGGTYEYTLGWIMKHGGVFKEEYGPYLAMEGRCHAQNMTKTVKIKNFFQLPKKKREIKSALRTHGPLLASIDANIKTFTFYDGGVYDDPECHTDPELRTHGVTIVGYGKENGQEYWIMKNSYGVQWGEDGYIRMAIQKNICGAKNFVYFITFENNESEKCYGEKITIDDYNN